MTAPEEQCWGWSLVFTPTHTYALAPAHICTSTYIQIAYNSPTPKHKRFVLHCFPDGWKKGEMKEDLRYCSTLRKYMSSLLFLGRFLFIRQWDPLSGNCLPKELFPFSILVLWVSSNFHSNKLNLFRQNWAYYKTIVPLRQHKITSLKKLLSLSIWRDILSLALSTMYLCPKLIKTSEDRLT